MTCRTTVARPGVERLPDIILLDATAPTAPAAAPPSQTEYQVALELALTHVRDYLQQLQAAEPAARDARDAAQRAADDLEVQHQDAEADLAGNAALVSDARGQLNNAVGVLRQHLPALDDALRDASSAVTALDAEVSAASQVLHVAQGALDGARSSRSQSEATLNQTAQTVSDAEHEALRASDAIVAAEETLHQAKASSDGYALAVQHMEDAGITRDGTRARYRAAYRAWHRNPEDPRNQRRLRGARRQGRIADQAYQQAQTDVAVTLQRMQADAPLLQAATRGHAEAVERSGRAAAELHDTRQRHAVAQAAFQQADAACLDAERQHQVALAAHGDTAARLAERRNTLTALDTQQAAATQALAESESLLAAAAAAQQQAPESNPSAPAGTSQANTDQLPLLEAVQQATVQVGQFAGSLRVAAGQHAQARGVLESLTEQLHDAEHAVLQAEEDFRSIGRGIADVTQAIAQGQAELADTVLVDDLALTAQRLLRSTIVEAALPPRPTQATLQTRHDDLTAEIHALTTLLTDIGWELDSTSFDQPRARLAALRGQMASRLALVDAVAQVLQGLITVRRDQETALASTLDALLALLSTPITRLQALANTLPASNRILTTGQQRLALTQDILAGLHLAQPIDPQYGSHLAEHLRSSIASFDASLRDVSETLEARKGAIVLTAGDSSNRTLTMTVRSPFDRSFIEIRSLIPDNPELLEPRIIILDHPGGTASKSTEPFPFPNASMSFREDVLITLFADEARQHRLGEPIHITFRHNDQFVTFVSGVQPLEERPLSTAEEEVLAGRLLVPGDRHVLGVLTAEVRSMLDAGAAGGNATGSQPQSLTPIGGLVARWLGNGNARDEVSGIDGVLQGDVTFDAGLMDPAFRFDQPESSVQIASTSAIDFDRSRAFSIAAPVKVGDMAGIANDSAFTIFERGEFTSNSPSYGMALRPGMGTIDVWLQGASNASRLYWRGPLDVDVTDWQHYVVTYDGSSRISGVRVYANGRELSPTYTEDTLNTSTRSSSPATIGDGFSANPYRTFAPGVIDEISFYDRALTHPEIQLAARAGMMLSLARNYDAAVARAGILASGASSLATSTRLVALRGQQADAQATLARLMAESTTAQMDLAKRLQMTTVIPTFRVMADGIGLRMIYEDMPDNVRFVITPWSSPNQILREYTLTAGGGTVNVTLPQELARQDLRAALVHPSTNQTLEPGVYFIFKPEGMITPPDNIPHPMNPLALSNTIETWILSPAAQEALRTLPTRISEIEHLLATLATQIDIEEAAVRLMEAQQTLAVIDPAAPGAPDRIAALDHSIQVLLDQQLRAVFQALRLFSPQDALHGQMSALLESLLSQYDETTREALQETLIVHARIRQALTDLRASVSAFYEAPTVEAALALKPQMLQNREDVALSVEALHRISVTLEADTRVTATRIAWAATTVPVWAEVLELLSDLNPVFRAHPGDVTPLHLTQPRWLPLSLLPPTITNADVERSLPGLRMITERPAPISEEQATLFLLGLSESTRALAALADRVINANRNSWLTRNSGAANRPFADEYARTWAQYNRVKETHQSFLTTLNAALDLPALSHLRTANAELLLNAARELARDPAQEEYATRPSDLESFPPPAVYSEERRLMVYRLISHAEVSPQVNRFLALQPDAYRHLIESNNDNRLAFEKATRYALEDDPRDFRTINDYALTVIAEKVALGDRWQRPLQSTDEQESAASSLANVADDLVNQARLEEARFFLSHHSTVVRTELLAYGYSAGRADAALQFLSQYPQILVDVGPSAFDRTNVAPASHGGSTLPLPQDLFIAKKDAAIKAAGADGTRYGFHADPLPAAAAFIGLDGYDGVDQPLTLTESNVQIDSPFGDLATAPITGGQLRSSGRTHVSTFEVTDTLRMVDISFTTNHFANLALFRQRSDGKTWESTPFLWSQNSRASADTLSSLLRKGRYLLLTYVPKGYKVVASGQPVPMYPDRLKADLLITSSVADLSNIQGIVSREGRENHTGVSIRVATFNSAGKRLDPTEAPDLNTDQTTWIVIHGRRDAEDSKQIEELARALHDSAKRSNTPQQILTVDWRNAAGDNQPMDTGLQDADWTIPVGLWVARQFNELGMSPGSLNFVGHSHGSYVSYFASAGLSTTHDQVGSIVALDSARDVPVWTPSKWRLWENIGNRLNSTQIDFASVSQTSWALHSSDYGSHARALTADYSFEVIADARPDGTAFDADKAHGFAVTLFSNLIQQRQSGDESALVSRFSLDHLLDHTPPGPFRHDVYKVTSLEPAVLLGGKGYEGVIRVTASPDEENPGWYKARAESLQYVHETTGLAIRESSSGLVLDDLGIAGIVDLETIGGRYETSRWVGALNPRDIYWFKPARVGRLRIRVESLAPDSAVLLRLFLVPGFPAPSLSIYTEEASVQEIDVHPGSMPLEIVVEDEFLLGFPPRVNPDNPYRLTIELL